MSSRLIAMFDGPPWLACIRYHWQVFLDVGRICTLLVQQLIQRERLAVSISHVIRSISLRLSCKNTAKPAMAADGLPGLAQSLSASMLGSSWKYHELLVLYEKVVESHRDGRDGISRVPYKRLLLLVLGPLVE
jgi:hypothetical protein